MTPSGAIGLNPQQTHNFEYRTSYYNRFIDSMKYIFGSTRSNRV